MVNHYYLAKGLNKLAQGWHEMGEDAVAISIYRYVIRMHRKNPEATFGDQKAEYYALVQDYEALNRCSNIDEKQLIRN